MWEILFSEKRRKCKHLYVENKCIKRSLVIVAAIQKERDIKEGHCHSYTQLQQMKHSQKRKKELI